MLLKNAWHAVAGNHESKHAPLARAVCREPIVLCRRMNGAFSAFEDCCPHRVLPLAKGFLESKLTGQASATSG